MNDRLLKKLILETIQEVLGGEEEHEVGADKEFLAKFRENCQDYGDVEEVRAAWKEIIENRKGGVNREQKRIIDEYASHFSESMSQNYRDNEKHAVQGYKGHGGKSREKDSPTYLAIQQIERKALALYHKVEKALRSLGQS